MEVLDWKSLTAHEGYQCLEMEQTLATGGGQPIVTTRCPIRINGQKLVAGRPAPALGQDRERIVTELLK
jgi:crotonobetainyl-CoA:carnitine CoA-transferase CaiB-like acyl-CoA transferase